MAVIKLPGFAGVDAGGGSFRIAEGDYLMKCTSCEPGKAKSSGNDMIVFQFTGLQGASKNKKFWIYCALTDEALWKLRQTLEALGVECPDDPSKLDTDEVIDVEVIGTVVDNEYDGKTNSKLAEVRVAEDVVEDEKPAGKKAASSKNGGGKKALPKLVTEELEEMDADELEGVVEKYNLDVDLSAFKTERRKINAVVAAAQAAKVLQA